MPDLTTKDGLLERMVTATESLVTDVPAKFDEYLKIENLVSESKKFNSQSLSANTYTSLTLDIAKTDYTPIGLVGYNVATTNNITVTAFYLDGTNIQMRLYNPGSATSPNITVHVLYIKS